MRETIELKAELLCRGLSADDATIGILEKQNPNLIWKTGNNGCFFEFDDTRLLAAVVHGNNKTSPYSFSMLDGCIAKEGQIVKERVNATIYPEWYNVKLSTGRFFTEVFLLEGEYFFHQAYKGCDYMACGTGCSFCATGVRGNRESTPTEIGEAAGIIKKYISGAQICLGGGTYLPVSSNVKYFAECIREIRKKDENIPIWIEMVPPTRDDVKLLIELGATAFGFNLELWDEEKRKEICPGKSSITKQHYLDVLAYTAQLLPDHVGSCLLVGLDKPENIKNGIRELTTIGVHPCLLPFKPFDDSKLVGHSPCKSQEILELSYYAVESIYNNGLDLLKNQGCMLCECCTVMHDIWRRKYKEVE